MKNVAIIKGQFVTEAPLSIAMPVAEYCRENQWRNFPVLPRGDGQTAYLPATTVRGAIRRGAALAQIGEGQKTTMKQMYFDMIGQTTTSVPDEVDLVAIAKERDDNPVADLFGAGIGLKSRLRVSHWMPADDVLPIAITTVRKDLADTDGALELLTAEDQAAFYNRTAANAKRADAAGLLKKLERERRKLAKDGADTDDVDAQIEAAKALVDKHKDEMGDMDLSTKHIAQHHALPPGLALTGKMVIENYRERDLELIEAGLDALSRWPILGAQSARGCGEISGSFDVIVNGELVKTIQIGGFEPARATEIHSIAAE